MKTLISLTLFFAVMFASAQQGSHNHQPIAPEMEIVVDFNSVSITSSSFTTYVVFFYKYNKDEFGNYMVNTLYWNTIKDKNINLSINYQRCINSSYEVTVYAIKNYQFTTFTQYF